MDNKDFLMGRGGSSSGRVLDYGSRGPQFENHWKLGFFRLSLLFVLSLLPFTRTFGDA